MTHRASKVEFKHTHTHSFSRFAIVKNRVQCCAMFVHAVSFRSLPQRSANPSSIWSAFNPSMVALIRTYSAAATPSSSSTSSASPPLITRAASTAAGRGGSSHCSHRFWFLPAPLAIVQLLCDLDRVLRDHDLVIRTIWVPSAMQWDTTTTTTTPKQFSLCVGEHVEIDLSIASWVDVWPFLNIYYILTSSECSARRAR